MILQTENKLPEFFGDTKFDTSNNLLASEFSLKREQQKKVKLILYKDGVTFEDQNTIKYLLFDFDVKFTLLRQKRQSTEKQQLGEAYGIKFQRIPEQGQLIIYHSDKDILIKWRDQLSGLINQRGFHDLYKPYRKIGKGNSATVYLAERYQDHKKIAIKAFAKQSIAHQPRGKESLINQIQIMRKFNHPVLMKLFEVFETDNSYYLAIEHLQGGQLFEKVNNRRFSLKQIQQILRRLVEGLTQMHKQSIIHRDLKPQNLIFRTPNNLFDDIVIADFGLATKSDADEYIFIRCGTPGYVAPQIISFKGKTGQQTISDVYSLGIIAHILATGRSPFTGKQYQEVLQQNRASNFNFELQIYKHVDPVLLSLIKQMVKTNPQERIKTKQILNHDFFKNQKLSLFDQKQSQLTVVSLVHGNNKKNYQKLIVDQCSFTIAKPQILKGNDQQYDSCNSVQSSNSVSASPQSIKLSSYTASKANKRQRQIDPQFHVGTRKSARISKNVNISQLNKKQQSKSKQQIKQVVEQNPSQKKQQQKYKQPEQKNNE